MLQCNVRGGEDLARRRVFSNIGLISDSQWERMLAVLMKMNERADGDEGVVVFPGSGIVPFRQGHHVPTRTRQRNIDIVNVKKSSDEVVGSWLFSALRCLPNFKQDDLRATSSGSVETELVVFKIPARP